MVHDPTPFEGPLAGALAGLVAASTDIVLVIGGDMPGPVPAVIDAMLDALDDPRIEAAVLEHDGQPRPLPLVLRRRPAVGAAERLISSGERRLGALRESLRSGVIKEPDWRKLDPAARTLRDIDTPADLD
jgi:molybdopterin-guanine dinucleotide biosynthesis protein A